MNLPEDKDMQTRDANLNSAAAAQPVLLPHMLLGVVGLLLVFVLGFLLIAIFSTRLAAEWKLVLLMLVALFCLMLSMLTAEFWIRQRGRVQSGTLPVVIVLAAAYGVPAVIFLLPDMLNISLLPAPEGVLADLARVEHLVPGQPWFFIWQALVLAGYSLSRQIFQRKSVRSVSRSEPLFSSLPVVWQILDGLLAGLGLWLAASFLYLIFAPPSLQNFPPLIITPLRMITFIVALLAAPWAEERFFREELIAKWQGRLGWTGSALASAALFAVLQAQIRTWLLLPAFLLGFGMAQLICLTHSRRAAFVAHILYNILAFALGWFLVL